MIKKICLPWFSIGFAILVFYICFHVVYSLKQNSPEEVDVNQEMLLLSDIPDSDILSKTEFLGVITAMVSECGGNCECSKALMCRKDALAKELNRLGKARGWMTLTQMGIKLWFLENVVNNRDLIKSSNRLINFPGYYEKLTVTFSGNEALEAEP